MARTLLTGFGAFSNVDDNPSARLASAVGLPHEVLEVSYQAVDSFVVNFKPLEFDNLLMMGVATTREQVSVELVAQNLRSGLDVQGQSRDGLIESGGPDQIASSLWSQELVEFLKIQHPHAVALSMDAGAYLCNYLYYQALRNLAIPRIGFLHVVMPDKVPLEAQRDIVLDIVQEITG